MTLITGLKYPPRWRCQQTDNADRKTGILSDWKNVVLFGIIAGLKSGSQPFSWLTSPHLTWIGLRRRCRSLKMKSLPSGDGWGSKLMQRHLTTHIRQFELESWFDSKAKPNTKRNNMLCGSVTTATGWLTRNLCANANYLHLIRAIRIDRRIIKLNWIESQSQTFQTKSADPNSIKQSQADDKIREHSDTEFDYQN